MATNSSSESPEAKELSLVGKVEMRIALADSDAKLESLLNTYLAPLLLKLASEHVNVRNKVISVCQHVNTRIKAPSIKLPVTALLGQYKKQQNALIRHFDLLYIQQGFERLPLPERLDLLPALLNGLSQNYQESQVNTANLFNLFLKLLHQLKLPPRGSKEDQELRPKLGLTEGNDAEFVAAWIGKLILFYNLRTPASNCPGLTAKESEFLNMNGKPDTWNSTASGGLNLVETKVFATKFLASGAFTESEKFLPAVFASADPNSRLSDIGNDILKSAIPAISLEDSDLVRSLFEIYLGTSGIESSGRPAVRASLQGKILGLLCKSQLATKFAPEILEIAKAGFTIHLEDTSAKKTGLEATKLRTQIFSFINWVARIAPASDISSVAPALVGHLRSYVENQGWPTSDEEYRSNSAEQGLRIYAYESIGILAKASPSDLLFNTDLDLLRWLFNSLAGDGSGKDVSLSIEQSLSSVLGAFSRGFHSHVHGPLVDLLLHYTMLKPGDQDRFGNPILRSTRYIAVRFANRCLPFSDVNARWMDLLALSGGSDERGEVIEEGKRGLDPHWYKILNPASVSTGSTSTLKSSEDSPYAMPNVGKLVEYLFSNKEKAFALERAYSSAVDFCRTVLFHNAILQSSKAPVIDADWERTIDALIQNDEETRKTVAEAILKTQSDDAQGQQALKLLTDAALTGFTSTNLGDATKSGKCLLDLYQLGPISLQKFQSSQISNLQSQIYSSDPVSRRMASHVFGLLATSGAHDEVVIESMLQKCLSKAKLWESAIGSAVHQVHGSVLALAYWLSRSKARGIDGHWQNMTVTLQELLLRIMNQSRDKEIVEAAILAISQLSLFGVITDSNDSGLSDKLESLRTGLVKVAEKGDENAVYALGHLSMLYDETPDEEGPLWENVDSLYKLHEKRQPELHFAVGSALSCAAIGWDSKSLIGMRGVDDAIPKMPARTITLERMMKKVLENCKQTKPSLRQASVVWLLCLVQYCGHCSQVQQRLRQCQSAFKGFLADRESLSQEAASRGLTLVYEKGDAEVKDELVRDLVNSFTATKSNLSGTVSDDTQLFEPGALPTGQGSSVTTYKDIVSLASEVGDPSLVYRFMSLASNSAIWSSRAAFGRFGLSRILSDSSTDGYLAQNPKLYSVLYRYRFDPNDNVRSAMNDIWTALVKDSKATIDLHFDRILEDLFKSILNKEWRTRQASCAALADLLQGRQVSTYENRLTRIWELTFKVCDDIKETVRIAAMQLARVLTGILVRSLEAGEQSAKNAHAMLQQVLPFLLSPSGLESSAKDVQAFSLVTLMDIIKKAKPTMMRPYLAELIARLLGLLSSIEPEAVNYLHLNAEKYGMTEQQIDDARLSSVKLSPMMEAIERCLDMLDEVSMKELDAALTSAAKTVIGLPSKVGVSRVLVTLATRHRFIFQPYADGYLKLLRRQVLDRNDTISATAAATCGYLCRIASDKEILQLLQYSKNLYFESEDDRHRTVAGELLLAFGKYATDRFSAVASASLPFAFFGSHDTYEPAKELFESAWNENVGGSRAVLLYLREITDLSVSHMDSARWSIKHTAAFTVAATVSAASGKISIADSEVMWPALQKAMDGKTWEGKEKVLEAFVLFARMSSLPRTSDEVRDQIQKVILRESKRTNIIYRPNAFGGLAEIVKAFRTIDWFELVRSVVVPVVEERMAAQDDMDIDSGQLSKSSMKTTSETTVANGILALLESVSSAATDGILGARLSQTLETVHKGLHTKSNVVAKSIFEGEKSLYAALVDIDPARFPDQELASYCLTLADLEDFTEPVRICAAEAAVPLSSLAGRSSMLQQTFHTSVYRTMSKDRSHAVQEILKRATATERS